MPVEKNLAIVHIIEAHEQVNECRLARSRRSDYRDELTRLDFQIHVFDKRHFGSVAEADIFEFDLALGLFDPGVVAVGALVGLIEQIEHALRTRERGLKVVRNVADADERLHEEL